MSSSKKKPLVAKHERSAEKARTGKDAVSMILKKRTDKSNEFFVVQGDSSCPKKLKTDHEVAKRPRRSLRERSAVTFNRVDSASSTEESEVSKENEIFRSSPRTQSQKKIDKVSPRRSRRKQTLTKRLFQEEELDSWSSSDSDIFPQPEMQKSPNKSISLTKVNVKKHLSPPKRRHLRGTCDIEDLLERETNSSTSTINSGFIPAAVKLELEFSPLRASPRSSTRHSDSAPSPRVRKRSGFYVDIIPEVELSPDEAEFNRFASKIQRSVRQTSSIDDMLNGDSSDHEEATKTESKNLKSPSVQWRLRSPRRNRTPSTKAATSSSDDDINDSGCKKELKIRLVKCDIISPGEKIGSDVAATPESQRRKTRSRPPSNLSMIAEGDDAADESDETRTPTRRKARTRRSGRAASPVATATIRSRQTTPERSHMSLHRTALENSPRMSPREKKPRKSLQELVHSPTTRRTGQSPAKNLALNGTRSKNDAESQPSSPSKSTSEARTPKKTPSAKPRHETSSPSKTPVRKFRDSPSQSTPKRKPATPSGTPGQARLKSGPCTPSMPQRAGAVTTPSTPMEEARAKLHVSAVPKELLCRELMFEKVRQFLAARLEDRSGGAMYISGVPGTGKTATVRKVVDALQAEHEFQYIEVNGMCMTTPHQLYTQIYEALTNCRLPWAQALAKLERHFTGKTKRLAAVIVVDELDLICNSRQDVVYNLLDWPRRAPVVIITIANTMDLPERLLHGKVASRLGLTRAVFKPYTSTELELIVASRLLGINAFDKDAVRFVAKKVASISGDCRRALDICRRATEVAESGTGGVVTMDHVQTAIDETMLSFKVKAIKGLSRLEQAFLRAVANSVDAGTEETTFFKVYRDLLTFCTLEGLHTPTVSAAQSACARLSHVRLIISGKHGVHAKILLNCDPDDIHYALAVK